MKILFITTGLPWPAKDGGRIRVSNIIEGLERDHDLVFAIADKNAPAGRSIRADGSTRDVRALKSATRDPIGVLGKLTWGRYRHVCAPSTHHRFRQSFLELVDAVKPDLIWYTRLYCPWRCGFPAQDIPIVLDMDNIESQIYSREADTSPFLKRFIIRADLPRFSAIQRQIAERCKTVILAGEDSTGMLGRANVRIVPNGFDFSSRPIIGPPTGQRLVFIGWLEYKPNADGLKWFCREVFPRIKESMPNLEIDIIGRYPPNLEHLGQIPGIRLRGFVDDADPVLRQASAMVVPLRVGGGTRIKILQAWSMGLPVVSTSVGCEGLGAQDSRQLLIADDPREFAARCVEIISDRLLAVRVATQAYEYGLRKYDWSLIYDQLKSVLEEAAAGAQK